MVMFQIQRSKKISSILLAVLVNMTLFFATSAFADGTSVILGVFDCGGVGKILVTDKIGMKEVFDATSDRESLFLRGYGSYHRVRAYPLSYYENQVARLKIWGDGFVWMISYDNPLYKFYARSCTLN